MKKCSM